MSKKEAPKKNTIPVKPKEGRVELNDTRYRAAPLPPKKKQ